METYAVQGLEPNGSYFARGPFASLVEVLDLMEQLVAAGFKDVELVKLAPPKAGRSFGRSVVRRKITTS